MGHCLYPEDLYPGDFTEEVFQLASEVSDSPFSSGDLQFAVECTFIALMSLE